MTIQEYSTGFAFNGDLLLGIKKTKPNWQAGKRSVPGGKIEVGETPIEAMVREFREETGLETIPEDWKKFAILRGESFICHFFKAENLPIFNAKTMTDEFVFVDAIDNFSCVNSINNIIWLAKMAKSIDTDRADHFIIDEKY